MLVLSLYPGSWLSCRGSQGTNPPRLAFPPPPTVPKPSQKSQRLLWGQTLWPWALREAEPWEPSSPLSRI